MNAYTAMQITLTKQAALRCRAIVEARAIIPFGYVYVYQPEHISTDPATGWPSVCISGQWHPLTERGVEQWAAEEGLDWLRPDGTIYRVPREVTE